MNKFRTALLAAFILFSTIELRACAYLQNVQTISTAGPVNCSYHMQFDIYVDNNNASMDYIVTDEDGFIVEFGCIVELPNGNNSRTISFQYDCGEEFEISWIGRNSPNCSGGSCAGGILNIDLISFRAEKSKEGVTLQWEAVHDEQFERFSVERSVNGTDYQAVGEVPAGFDTQGEIVRYNFVDDNPSPGLNYYRLSMMSTDGSVKYSDMRSVKISDLDRLTIWPNPAGNILHLDPAGMPASGLAIYDRLGKIRKKIPSNAESARSRSIEVDVSDLNPGLYMIGAEGDFRRFVKR